MNKLHLSPSQLKRWTRNIDYAKANWAARYKYGFKTPTSDAMYAGSVFENLLFDVKTKEAKERYQALCKKNNPAKEDIIERLSELDIEIPEKSTKKALLSLLDEEDDIFIGEPSSRLLEVKKVVDLIKMCGVDKRFGKGKKQVKLEMPYLSNAGEINLIGYADFIGEFTRDTGDVERAIVDVKYTNSLASWNEHRVRSEFQKDMYPYMWKMLNDEELVFYYFVAGYGKNDFYQKVPRVKVMRYIPTKEGIKRMKEVIEEIVAYDKSEEWKSLKLDKIDLPKGVDIYDYLGFKYTNE
jgi:hypothetical protein